MSSKHQPYEEYRKKYPLHIIVPEAAEIARRSRATIYAWSSQGLLDEVIVRPGRNMLLNRDHFIEFLQGGGPV